MSKGVSKGVFVPKCIIVVNVYCLSDNLKDLNIKNLVPPPPPTRTKSKSCNYYYKEISSNSRMYTRV